MRLSAALLAWSALIALSGCGSDSSPPEGAFERSDARSREPATDRAQVAEIACEHLEYSILTADLDRASLCARYGRPDSIITTTEPNRHVEGAVDSLFGVHYPGFVAYFRTPTGGRDLISSVAVTDNRYVSEPSIGIGTTEEDVVAALGEPTRREPGALVYACGLGAEQPVTFELREDTVHAISIAYYVD